LYSGLFAPDPLEKPKFYFYPAGGAVAHEVPVLDFEMAMAA